ncbi:uncharacterized protein PV09_02927 [Verruconis gallopava]|uniref:SART-1 protein n=1 Tax=Verruconis gallopava TaxID=253628 RepID=A0A0D1XUS2_9PEZI|nr:uncharacterized protein PV09_02927 [Verruconis gallopava]KIW06491.1 hypothetical protein PV09_02927 [Verruconis gallopava]
MADTLSVEAVNQMRKAMGLPLIPVPGEGGLEFQQENKDDVPESDLTLDERQARGSANFAKLVEEQKKAKEREERKNEIKRQRELAARNVVLKGASIAEVEDDMAASDWLKSMGKRQKKLMAEQAAKEEEEAAKKKAAAEAEYKVTGMRVAHEVGDMVDGDILTFQDRAIDEGDSEEEYQLESRQLQEEARRKAAQEAKKFRPGAVYDPLKEGGLLSQYDEEVAKSFTIDQSGNIETRGTTTGAQEQDKPKGVTISLTDLLDEKQPVSDYKEFKAPKPKKPKKAKNARKRARDEEDDIFPTNTTMDIDISAAAPKAKKRNVDDFNFEDDEDLARQLAAARRKALQARKKPSDIAKQIKEQEASEMQDVKETGEVDDGGLLIDASTEWANSLDPEAVAQEAAEEEERRRRREASNRSHTSETKKAEDGDDVEMSYAEADEAEEAAQRAARTPSAPPPEDDEKALGDEEELGGGLAATLKLLKERNLVQTASITSDSFTARQKFLAEKARREAEAELRARNQRLKERERMQGMSARDREEAARNANSARDFQESRALADLFNKEYKPNINLKYTDEFGNEMSTKEAFKHLSHQFHGKGSGKQKQEKRLKKMEEEKKRMAASILDSSQFAGGNDKKKNKQAGVRLQ